MNKKLILVVDDNKETSLLIKTILELNGYDSDIRYNGLECIEYLKNRIPDLILLDMMMPVMDGIEALNIIKNNKNYNNIPIIAITAKNDELFVKEIFEKGITDYIEKPFKNFELLARVKSALNKNSELIKAKDKTSATKINDELTKLKNIYNLKNTFITCLTHDLKTPITSIRGLAELLLTNDKIPKEKVIEFLKNIIKQADNLTELINEIWEIVRKDSEPTELNISSIPLKDIIEFLNFTFTDIALSKKINFEVINNSNIEKINCDFFRIKELLSNIISNAIKFTIKGNVSVIINNDNKNIYFEIRDTGIGINETDLSKIFEKFYKSKNSLNSDNNGWGIGLYIAIKIAYAHGGDIIVTSENNKGSLFKVIIPLEISSGKLEF